REINPRPGADFDPAFALLHLDRKLAAAGVTTQFHAVSFAERTTHGRSVAFASALCHVVNALRPLPHAAIENHVLHRLDLRAPGARDAILAAFDRSTAGYPPGRVALAQRPRPRPGPVPRPRGLSHLHPPAHGPGDERGGVRDVSPGAARADGRDGDDPA